MRGEESDYEGNKKPKEENDNWALISLIYGDSSGLLKN